MAYALRCSHWTWPYNLLCKVYSCNVPGTTEDEFIDTYGFRSISREDPIAKVENCISYLNEMERNCLLMHFRDHMDRIDIGKDHYKLPVGSPVHSAINSGYRKLRHLMIPKFYNVAELDISATCFNILVQNKILTIPDILNTDFSTFKNMKGLGPKCMRELVTCIMLQLNFNIPGIKKEDLSWLKLTDRQTYAMLRRIS